jgi:hypothetical protein
MSPKGWKHQSAEALVVLLAVAFVAHLVWSWLSALVPALIALVVLGVVYSFVLGRWRR